MANNDYLMHKYSKLLFFDAQIRKIMFIKRTNTATYDNVMHKSDK
jgi:hypothetical protein